MLITLTNSEWSTWFKTRNNRQLLKEYRMLKEKQPILKEHAGRKPGLYLGESAFLQLLNTNRGIECAESEMKRRNTPNMQRFCKSNNIGVTTKTTKITLRLTDES